VVVPTDVPITASGIDIHKSALWDCSKHCRARTWQQIYDVFLQIKVPLRANSLVRSLFLQGRALLQAVSSPLSKADFGFIPHHLSTFELQSRTLAQFHLSRAFETKSSSCSLQLEPSQYSTGGSALVLF
jgi:hypothetical protein